MNTHGFADVRYLNMESGWVEALQGQATLDGLSEKIHAAPEHTIKPASQILALWPPWQ